MAKGKSDEDRIREIGSRLKEARKLRNVAVEDIIAFINKRSTEKPLGESTYYQFESGEHEPRFRHGVLICKCLRIRTDWLFDGTGQRDA